MPTTAGLLQLAAGLPSTPPLQRGRLSRRSHCNPGLSRNPPCECRFDIEATRIAVSKLSSHAGGVVKAPSLRPSRPSSGSAACRGSQPIVASRSACAVHAAERSMGAGVPGVPAVPSERPRHSSIRPSRCRFGGGPGAIGCGGTGLRARWAAVTSPPRAATAAAAISCRPSGRWRRAGRG
jgi:hypothetical protein